MASRIYVGHKAGSGRVVFRSPETPTPEAFPQFGAVVGPFRTMRAALLSADTYPNPHIRCVADAERIARENV